jgi:hypothetical protein
MATASKVKPTELSEPLAERVPEFACRHYSPAEIAELWGLSVDSVRKIFCNEPGVLVIGNMRSKRGKRSYTTLRIPQTVLDRIHRRLTKV